METPPPVAQPEVLAKVEAMVVAQVMAKAPQVMVQVEAAKVVPVEAKVEATVRWRARVHGSHLPRRDRHQTCDQSAGLAGETPLRGVRRDSSPAPTAPTESPILSETQGLPTVPAPTPNASASCLAITSRLLRRPRKTRRKINLWGGYLRSFPRLLQMVQ